MEEEAIIALLLHTDLGPRHDVDNSSLMKNICVMVRLRLFKFNAQV